MEGLNIETKVKSFEMDFFGTHQMSARTTDGHLIKMGCLKSKNFQSIQIFKPSGELLVSRDIGDDSKHEWIHLLNGKIRARFYYYLDNTGYRHEINVPHTPGKVCTVKRG